METLGSWFGSSKRTPEPARDALPSPAIAAANGDWSGNWASPSPPKSPCTPGGETALSPPPKKAPEPKRETGGVWRAVLRIPGEGEVRLEWKSSEARAARQALAQRVSGLYGCGDGAGSVGEEQLAVSKFVEEVTWLELTRVAASEKLELGNLPFQASSLVSLRVLRLCGEDMQLAGGTLEAVLRQMRDPEMDELDLSSQRADVNQIQDLIIRGVVQGPSLSILRLRKCGLKELPPSALALLPSLRELDVSDNRIPSVPSALLQTCPLLEILNVESNAISVPSLDFRDCKLRTLRLGLNSLEYLPTLAPLTRLEELSVFAIHVKQCGESPDPLSVFCASPVSSVLLRTLGAQPIKVLPFTRDVKSEIKASLSLLFRSSSSIHPLLVSLLASLSEDAAFRLHIAEYAASAGLQMLLTMCQAPEPVCLHACVALSHSMKNQVNSRCLFSLGCAEQLLSLLSAGTERPATQLYVLHVFRSIVDTSGDSAELLLDRSSGRYSTFSNTLSSLYDAYGPAVDAHEGQMRGTTHPAVVCSALVLVGNLAFNDANRASLMSDQRLISLIKNVAESASSGIDGEDCCRPPARWRPCLDELGDQQAFSMIDRGTRKDVATSAKRALAILGVDDGARNRINMRDGDGEGQRGLRILSIDGGGVKGVASIRMLAELERRIGTPLYCCFDLVVGTSAGAIVASGIGNRMNMAECEKTYRHLVLKAFSLRSKVALNVDIPPEDGGVPHAPSQQGAAGSGEVGEGEERAGAVQDPPLSASRRDASWWQRFRQSGTAMRRVIMTGAKYESAPLMSALKEGFLPHYDVESCMIDSTLVPGACKTAAVAALCSSRPLKPFVFRNYQLPPGVKSIFPGSSCSLWVEALRASSAAPYFFEEYTLRSRRFQDGAIVANNPAFIAIHEAQRLFPGRSIDVVLSVGAGRGAEEKRDVRRSGGWGLIDTFGDYMVESATTSDRAEEALQIVAPLISGSSFFRLQVVDPRCNVEIDDTSPEAFAGLCSAVEEKIVADDALFAEVAAKISSPGGADKGGIGARPNVLIVESGPHGGGHDVYQGLRDILEEAGARCSTTSLACPGDGGSLDAGCLASIIAGSSARIVHIGCEALRSGGDLVLEWAMGAVEMEVGDAAEILSISASHSGLMTTTTDKPDVDTPGPGYFGGTRTTSENVQEEGACETCFDERRAEEGLRNRGAGEHRPSGEGEEGLETSTRNGLEGVGVDAQQTFRGCSRRYSRRLRRESSAREAALAQPDESDRGERSPTAGSGDSQMDEDARWREAAKALEIGLVGATAGEQGPEPGSPEGDFEPVRGYSSPSVRGQGPIFDTELEGGSSREASPAGAKSPCDRERAGITTRGGVSAESASPGANGKGEGVLVRRLENWRVVEVSQIERWVFSGSRVDASGRRLLSFDKAKASCIVGWDELLEPVGEVRGGRVCVVGKVLVLQGPIPREIAEIIIAAGAEAVVMPLVQGHQIGKRERIERLKAVYAGLVRGMSPAMAVTGANSKFGCTVYSCVF